MFRHDRKYDLVIPINYNYYKPKLIKAVLFLYTSLKTINLLQGV